MATLGPSSGDFTILPADDELSPDELLEAALAGTVPDDTEESVMAFGRGWNFDFVKGQFSPHGLAPARIDGLAQLRVWIEKTLRTSRLAHPIYSDVYGVDGLWDAYGQNVSPSITGKLTTQISEALLVHDRISNVTDFQFSVDPTSPNVFVSFRVVVDDDDDQGQMAFEAIPFGAAIDQVGSTEWQA